jgi:hypothetical protein
MAFSCVLASKASSTYPRGYASGAFFVCGLAEHHFEQPGGYGGPMIPIEEHLREAWYKFREYVNEEMDYDVENAARKLNGAGAFVDFLCGRRPVKNIKCAKHERGEWPTE